MGVGAALSPSSSENVNTEENLSNYNLNKRT